MILVTGATGQFGAKAIDHLLRKGVSPAAVAALVRDADKARELEDRGIEIRVGDYTDYPSLVRAFRNVDKLLLVSSNDKQAMENRTIQHINVMTAAKEAGVKHVVYTSFVRTPGFEDTAIAAFQQAHVQSEMFLQETGMAYTILQNGIYLEMIPVFAGEKVAATGVVYFPAGEGKASYVLREELAEAAAHVLTTEGHERASYRLVGPDAVAFGEIAAALSDATGKNIVYPSPSTGEFEATLKQMGVPEPYIGLFTMWATALSQGTMDVEDRTLEQLLGRKPTTMKQFIQKLYGQRV